MGGIVLGEGAGSTGAGSGAGMGSTGAGTDPGDGEDEPSMKVWSCVAQLSSPPQ